MKISSPSPRVLDEAQLDELFAFIENTRNISQDYDLPGIAAAIVQDDKIRTEVFGICDLESGERVTRDTLFHIASTHKSITAMLLATLIDDHNLDFDWDTPVVNIYPSFKLSDELESPADNRKVDATNTVTIRHLMSMSSGIPASAEDQLKKKGTAEDIFDLLPTIKLLGKPGEKFSYSNVCTSVAAYIGVLANNKGKMGELYEGYEQLLKDKIFDPIGMETATFSLDERQAKNYSNSYEYENGANGEIIFSKRPQHPTADPLAPSGFIKASIKDMARYMATQVSQGIAPPRADERRTHRGVHRGARRVVSQENLTETWKPQIKDTTGDGAYGMGWAINEKHGLDVISHGGNYDGFNSMLIFVPGKQCGMVLLTNFDDPGDFLETVNDKFIQLLTAA